ncbi:MAG: hypothetical protein ABS46_16395 [Cytophagaceae bacterium SCN 52-12]|nr:MAG: hypothetical protein ABS46_16395 [Cytophagaceae bacterium SCN 52-12]
MPSAVIVIPIVQPELRDFERVSLARCMKVLGTWPVCVIAPEQLDLSEALGSYAERIRIVRFDPGCFRSIAAYNRLMTSLEFYKMFDSYDFMLLYQLDAFVFEDRLAEWCQKGFDYIGAPAFNGEGFEALAKEEANVYARALSTHRLVFNGGLSLRKIAGIKRLLRVYNTCYPSWKGNEDMLFSLDSTRLLPLKPFMKLPGWEEALSFSFERSPAASYEINGCRLPFGCHAWQRYDPGFWAQFIY